MPWRVIVLGFPKASTVFSSSKILGQTITAVLTLGFLSTLFSRSLATRRVIVLGFPELRGVDALACYRSWLS